MARPKKTPEPAATVERTPFERFQQMTRALFRVDKRDVEKHERKQRPIKQE
jgi:hypothetical protein